MPPAGFEPTVPASERPQTHALDRVATAIGSESHGLRELVDCHLCRLDKS
jgi:hypothetical protein